MNTTTVRTEQGIKELVGLLPSEASYWRGVHGSSGLSARLAETNLCAEACNNPAFGHLFIKTFVELRRPLPAAIHATELLRGYRYLRFGHRDPDVQAAYALLHDSEMKRRILVRCMLIRPEYEYSRIAAKA